MQGQRAQHVAHLHSGDLLKLSCTPLLSLHSMSMRCCPLTRCRNPDGRRVRRFEQFPVVLSADAVLQAWRAQGPVL